MKQFSISVSISHILTDIYARSAMRAYVNHLDKELPLLTSDLRDALAIMVRDAFATIAVNLNPFVVDTSIDDELHPNLLEMTFELPDTAVISDSMPATVRRAIEALLALFVLRQLDAGRPEAYAAEIFETLPTIREMLHRASITMPRISPY